jgi:5'-3' exonuclease
MGIPSYYKKLIHTVPGLVSSHAHPVAWLFMDFNCLIYHCIPAIDPLLFTETALIAEVVRYTKEVVKEVAPQTGVYIAIDGVVPMAKMRQQRLRRFKSVFEKMHSTETTDTVPISWDKNAITPGTAFMKNLAIALQQVCDEKGWILSSADKPGEGEGKVVAQWRTGAYKGCDIAVYGMDADLIVLSLLGQYQNQLGAVWLFREQEGGFEWFSIDSLKMFLLQGRDPSFVLTYCFAMSVLGNDFLPSSLGLKMRDGGHDELLRCLTTPLLDGYEILEEHLYELFRTLAAFEPQRIAKYIKAKQQMANRCEEKGLGENNWPLSCIEEGLIGPAYAANYWKLIDGEPGKICYEYMRGIRWIWSYYTGQPICFNWFYPYSLPPLWSTLITERTHQKALSMQEDILVRAEDIRTQEQLALVLPLESWSLIPDCMEKKLPMLAPQFFPSSFDFEAVGKRMWWECEPLIPIPTVLELKALVSSYSLVCA